MNDLRLYKRIKSSLNRFDLGATGRENIRLKRGHRYATAAQPGRIPAPVPGGAVYHNIKGDVSEHFDQQLVDSLFRHK
jgi:hypothetical protein